MLPRPTARPALPSRYVWFTGVPLLQESARSVAGGDWRLTIARARLALSRAMALVVIFGLMAGLSAFLLALTFGEG